MLLEVTSTNYANHEDAILTWLIDKHTEKKSSFQNILVAHFSGYSEESSQATRHCSAVSVAGKRKYFFNRIETQYNQACTCQIRFSLNELKL